MYIEYDAGYYIRLRTEYLGLTPMPPYPSPQVRLPRRRCDAVTVVSPWRLYTRAQAHIEAPMAPDLPRVMYDTLTDVELDVVHPSALVSDGSGDPSEDYLCGPICPQEAYVVYSGGPWPSLTPATLRLGGGAPVLRAQAVAAHNSMQIAPASGALSLQVHAAAAGSLEVPSAGLTVTYPAGLSRHRLAVSVALGEEVSFRWSSGGALNVDMWVAP